MVFICEATHEQHNFLYTRGREPTPKSGFVRRSGSPLCPHLVMYEANPSRDQERPITRDDLSLTFTRVDAKWLRCNEGVTVPKDRLDAIDWIIVSDVLSLHFAGLPYFKSMASIGESVGLSKCAASLRIKKLNRLEYIRVTINKKSFSQTNTIEIGPRTITLFLQRDDVRSIDTSHPVPVNVQQEPSDPVPQVQHRPKQAVTPAPPTAAPTAILTSASDEIPREYFRQLKYYPKDDRHDFPLVDAELVFSLYGMTKEQAARWHSWKESECWQNIENKLNACKDACIEMKKYPEYYPDRTKLAPRFDYSDM